MKNIWLTIQIKIHFSKWIDNPIQLIMNLNHIILLIFCVATSKGTFFYTPTTFLSNICLKILIFENSLALLYLWNYEILIHGYKLQFFWIWIEMKKLDSQSKSKIRFWIWIVHHNPIHQIGFQSELNNSAIQSSNTLQMGRFSII